MVQPIQSRRRFLTITAAAGAAASVPRWAWASTALPISDWRGTALGAPASMRLVHPDRKQAQQAIVACVNEITRLEQIFSLYQDNSDLQRLNATGELIHPAQELVEVVAFALQLAQQSKGYFDPTIQPLYELYVAHFRDPATAADGPSEQALEQALSKVDHTAVTLDSDRIGFQRPGMAITLNGVAQGYITDRIAHLLAEYGFEDILIDVGEIRANGRRSNGRAWTAAVADPRGSDSTDQHILALELGKPNPALATSSGFGSPFFAAAQTGQLPDFHHLLNPHTGQSAAQYHSVSVRAPNAMLADGLSTTLSVMPKAQSQALLKQWTHTQAWLLEAQGELIELKASA